MVAAAGSTAHRQPADSHALTVGHPGTGWLSRNGRVSPHYLVERSEVLHLFLLVEVAHRSTMTVHAAHQEQEPSQEVGPGPVRENPGLPPLVSDQFADRSEEFRTGGDPLIAVLARCELDDRFIRAARLRDLIRRKLVTHCVLA